MAGKKGVKLRRGQFRRHNDLGTGIPKAECPYAMEMFCDEKKSRSLPFSRWNWGPNAEPSGSASLLELSPFLQKFLDHPRDNQEQQP
jgi:hypothetical protein